MIKLIVLLVLGIALSGCSATFDYKEYSLKEIPSAQIKIINEAKGFVYVGDFCSDVENINSCLTTAKYKLKQIDDCDLNQDPSTFSTSKYFKCMGGN